MSSILSTATVEVQVENVNDHVPQFEVSVFELSVIENLPIGSFVGQVTAVDMDGDTISYAFASGETGMNFLAYNLFCLLQSYIFHHGKSALLLLKQQPC